MPAQGPLVENRCRRSIPPSGQGPTEVPCQNATRSGDIPTQPDRELRRPGSSWWIRVSRAPLQLQTAVGNAVRSPPGLEAGWVRVFSRERRSRIRCHPLGKDLAQVASFYASFSLYSACVRQEPPPPGAFSGLGQAVPFPRCPKGAGSPAQLPPAFPPHLRALRGAPRELRFFLPRGG